MKVGSFERLLKPTGFVLFKGRGEGFTKIYYALKQEASDTNYCLNVIPNEFYTFALIKQRADYCTEKYGQNSAYWTSILKNDQNAFEIKLKQYRLRYLFRKDEIEEWVKGRYGDFLMGPIPSNLRREQIEYMIELLNKHNNLEIGFTEEPVEIYFAVSSKGIVLALRGDKPCAIWAMASINKNMIEAFQNEFERMWQGAIKNKHEVINFLNSQIGHIA